MRAELLEVHWHDHTAPILSTCFEPNADDAPPGCSARFATGGGDGTVRIWRIEGGPQKPPKVHFLACIGNTDSVSKNVVRFSPSGNHVAIAGDSQKVEFYQLDKTLTKNQAAAVLEPLSPQQGSQPQQPSSPQDADADHTTDSIEDTNEENIEKEAEENRNLLISEDVHSLEVWRLVRACNTNAKQVADLSWSPDGRWLAVASMDFELESVSATVAPAARFVTQIIDISKNLVVQELADHALYVHGVSWDPLNEALVTQSSDGYIILYGLKTTNQTIQVSGPHKFHSFKDAGISYLGEIKSLFRRPAFSPDGALLVTPAAVHDHRFVSILYTRGDLCKVPKALLPAGEEPSVAVSWSPVVYELLPSERAPAIKLPYRMIFAVASLKSVIIYDTQTLEPVLCARKFHIVPITDLAWSPDGIALLVASNDGYVSRVVVDTESWTQYTGTLLKPTFTLEGLMGKKSDKRREPQVKAVNQPQRSEPVKKATPRRVQLEQVADPKQSRIA